MLQQITCKAIKQQTTWRRLSWVVPVVYTLMHGSAQALSLGPLALYSVEGEPLRAEIEIVEKFPGEGEGQVELNIASQSEHRKAGLRYQNILGQLRFEPYRRSDNRLFLRVITVAPVEQKQFDMLLSVRWAGATARNKAYTFALKEGRSADTVSTITPVAPSAAPLIADPTNVALPAQPKKTTTATGDVDTALQARPAVSTGEKAGSAKTEKSVKESPTKMQEQTVKSDNIAGASRAPKSQVKATSSPAKEKKRPQREVVGTRITVKRGATLTGVAEQNRLRGISLEQMSAAIFQNNQSAFIASNINRLRAGHTLDVPNRQQAETMSRLEAQQLLQVHSKDFNEYRQKLADKSPALQKDKNTDASGGNIRAGVVDKKTGTSQDKLALSTNPNPNSLESKLASSAQKTLDTNLTAEANDITKELKALNDQVKNGAGAGALPPAPAPLHVPIADVGAGPIVNANGTLPALGATTVPADSIRLTPSASQTEGGASKGFFEDFWEANKYAILVLGIGLSLVLFLYLRRNQNNLAGISGDEDSSLSEVLLRPEPKESVASVQSQLAASLQQVQASNAGNSQARSFGAGTLAEDKAHALTQEQDPALAKTAQSATTTEGTTPSQLRNARSSVMADYDLTTISLDLDEPVAPTKAPSQSGGQRLS